MDSRQVVPGAAWRGFSKGNEIVEEALPAFRISGDKEQRRGRMRREGMRRMRRARRMRRCITALLYILLVRTGNRMQHEYDLRRG
jgi:hypothetical protein